MGHPLESHGVGLRVVGEENVDNLSADNMTEDAALQARLSRLDGSFVAEAAHELEILEGS